MTDLIHEYGGVVHARGTAYRVFVLGEERDDGTWAGWLEFRPSEEHGATLRTDRETSQPNRQALVYWATGLEPVYLEGAFERASETVA